MRPLLILLLVVLSFLGGCEEPPTIADQFFGVSGNEWVTWTYGPYTNPVNLKESYNLNITNISGEEIAYITFLVYTRPDNNKMPPGETKNIAQGGSAAIEVWDQTSSFSIPTEIGVYFCTITFADGSQVTWRNPFRAPI